MCIRDSRARRGRTEGAKADDGDHDDGHDRQSNEGDKRQSILLVHRLYVLAAADPTRVSEIVVGRPATLSSEMWTGAASRIVTVGAATTEPVIGSVPVFVTTTSADAAASDGLSARVLPRSARFWARYWRASWSASSGSRRGGAPDASAVGSSACVAVSAAMTSSERILERRSSTLPTT